MPIVHMCSKPEDAPANAVNLRDVSKEYENSVAPEHRATHRLWLYDTHVGLCIEEYERNGYSDSDFYMRVWNPETNKPESIEFASTRGWSYPCLASHADATPEVLEKYRAYRAEQDRIFEVARQKRIAMTPAKGKKLKVVRGRKVPVGTVGECIWIGARGYGERVGIKDDAGTVHWTAVGNVEVVA